ncbi:MAG: PrsW family glutamic-type intramembrane protease [Ktedonobacterales bacterium]
MNIQQYCPHCGSPVEGGNERCRTCGAAVVALPLSPSSEVSQSATSYADGSNSATPFVVSTPPATTPIASPSVGYDAASQGNALKAAAPIPPASMPGSAPPYVPGGYGYPSPMQGGYGSPQPAPAYGWPTYGAYAANSYTYHPYGGYGYGYPAYPYAYPWPYYPYSYYVPRRRPPTETYALVVSWVVTIAGGLSVICGLLVALLLLRTISRGDGDNLVTAGNYLGFFLAPLVGGAIALYYGIRGILRKPSPRFTLPHPVVFFGLTVVTLIAAVALWHINQSPGPAVAVLPLVCLVVTLPALTLLAYTTWRLHMPTSRRHIWMSLIYGSTLAALIALILNTIGEVIIVLFIYATQPGNSSRLTDPTNPTSDPSQLVGVLLLASVLAPLVEEGVKPLGALLIMPRLRTPASAFLTGMAAGVGFSIFETLSIYVGRGEADWIVVAIERLGAGFLHGVGAGMGALAWYYVVNGKGVRLRWLRAIGCFLYAVVQHGIYNGVAVLLSLPQPWSKVLQQPIYLYHLPLDMAMIILVIYWAAICAVLYFITGRLVRSPLTSSKPPSPGAQSSAPGGPIGPFDSTTGAGPTAESRTPVGSGTR